MPRGSRLVRWRATAAVRHAMTTTTTMTTTAVRVTQRTCACVGAATRVRYALKAVEVAHAHTQRHARLGRLADRNAFSSSSSSSMLAGGGYGMSDAAATTTATYGSNGNAVVLPTRQTLPMSTLICVPANASEALFFREVDTDSRHKHSHSRRGSGSGSVRAVTSAAHDGSDDDGDAYGGGVADDDDMTAHDNSYGGSSSSLRRLHSSSSDKSSRRLYCRLCCEEMDVAQTTRVHMWGSSRNVNTNHACREVLLNTMALLAMRGYPIDDMMTVWADVLYRHEAFARLRDLVSPRWSLERRARVLLRLLHVLKARGVVDLSLTGGVVASNNGYNSSSNATEVTVVQRRRLAFERLEYIGDCSWGTHMSSRIMVLFPVHQWVYSEHAYTFNCFRDACEMNVTLGDIFDMLQLQQLMPCALHDRLGAGKAKADAVEALLGELHCVHAGLEPALYDEVAYVEINGTHEAPLCALVQHCLCEVYDLIVLGFTRMMAASARTLAAEVAANFLWRTARGALRRNKTRRAERYSGAAVVAAATPAASGSSSSTSDAATAAATTATTTTAMTTSSLLAGPRWVVPAPPALHVTPQPFPRTLPHPLLAYKHDSNNDNNSCNSSRRRDDDTLSALLDVVPATRCIFTGADLLARLHDSFVHLQLLHDDTAHLRGVVAATVPRIDVLVDTLVPHLRYKRNNNSSDDDGDEAAAAAAAAACDAALLLDELEPMYVRDACYALHTQPTPAATTTTTPPSSLSSSLAFALDTCHPPLSAEVAAIASSDDGSNGRDVSATSRDGWPVCGHAPSRFVPPTAKTPIGGVVTERNVCRGQYAFWAYGYTHALRCDKAVAMNASNDADKNNVDDNDSVDSATVEQAMKYWQSVQQQRCRAKLQGPRSAAAVAAGSSSDGNDKAASSTRVATTTAAATAL